MNTQQSYKYQLNEKDLLSICWLLLHIAIGSILSALIQIIPQINFGVYGPVVAILLGVLSATFSKYISGSSQP